MPNRPFRYYSEYIKHARLKKPPAASFSEREHAVQTALAFGLILAIASVLLVGTWLLR